MCARQHTFHSRGSLLPTREGIDRVPRIPLWNPQLPISVLELTKHEVVGGGSDVTGLGQPLLHCVRRGEGGGARAQAPVHT